MRRSKGVKIQPKREGTVPTAEKRKKEERCMKLKEEQLHGKFVKEIKEVISVETW